MKPADLKLEILSDFMDSMDQLKAIGYKPSDELKRIEKMKELLWDVYLKGYKEGLENNLKEIENND